MQVTTTSESAENRMRRRLQVLQDMAPDGVSGILKLELISCDPVAQTCTLRARTEPWMKNGAGTLHGGLGATILDHTMGALFYMLKDTDAFCPTIEMQSSFHRPLKPGESVLAKVRVIAKSRRLAHMAAEIYQESDPERLCLSGTSIYYLVE